MSSNNQPSASSPPPHDSQTRQKAQKELGEIVRILKHDLTLKGIFDLAKDGILRSLAADREVVDAVPLRPELIKAYLDCMPYNTEDEINYRGVDGTKVPREQWYNPDKSELPPPYTPPEDRRNFTPEELEKNRLLIEGRRRGWRPEFVSDHDLGLKGETSSLEDRERFENFDQ